MLLQKKVAIITLGCKVNQYESNGLAWLLENAGFKVVFDLDPGASFYILNTCAVTNESERKSRGYIAKIKKVSPEARLYICGCASQHKPEQFASFENVRVILGDFNKQLIADMIIKDYKSGFKSPDGYIDNTQTTVFDDFKITKGERTRSVIKIQDGCNNFCSYCLIPYLRGRERSRALQSVQGEIEFHARATKEIIFTGINLSNYGKDFNDGTSLKSVAILMRDYPHVRFRFSSLEQHIIDEDFLRVLVKTPNFAPHFHLSLQSGSSKTLKDMNRKYSPDEYYSKLELIRKYYPNAAITTDVIVGFPTETDEDFNETYEFVKKCKFAKMHIFPYSKRSNTLASKMPNIVTNVKERVKALTELDNEMKNEYLTGQVGKILNVVVETLNGGYFSGYSENYVKCYIDAKTAAVKNNELIKVKALGLFEGGLLCEKITLV